MIILNICSKKPILNLGTIAETKLLTELTRVQLCPLSRYNLPYITVSMNVKVIPIHCKDLRQKLVFKNVWGPMPEVIQKWFFQSDLCLRSVSISASLFPLPETLALLKPLCRPPQPPTSLTLKSTVFTHPSSSIKTTSSKICQLIGISYIAFVYLL